MIDSDGKNLGKKPINEALDYAYSKDLDLVKVSSNGVCKVMNYEKEVYKEDKRLQEEKKKNKVKNKT